jgi:hypothetical protein
MDTKPIREKTTMILLNVLDTQIMMLVRISKIEHNLVVRSIIRRGVERLIIF